MPPSPAGAGDGDRVEVFANDLGRRAGLLHLGDQANRPRTGERREEITGWWRLGDLMLHLIQRHPTTRHGHLETLGSHDRFEDRRNHRD